MTTADRPSPLWQPGEPLTFSAARGMERTLVPERTTWIGGGNFGEVFSVHGIMRHAGEQPTQARVAIKQFDNRENVERAVRYHDLLARLSLPVFGMYEAEREKNLILMPNGNTDRRLMVSQNRSLARSALERHPLDTIENTNQLIASLIQGVRMAAHFGLFIPNDAYLYSVRRNGGSGIASYSLDDTDNVRTQKEAAVGTTELLGQNVRAVRDSLRDNLLSFAVRSPESGILADRLQAILQNAQGIIEEELGRVCEC
ncbi:MAG: hypothetical protein PHE68_03590 [Candidatus Peribacteraceae bacterium]|nr:hypothetical protein [Candidatus Peribacteraceae bacterium]MDD5074696.1 hypothetical protein [Candidatus Peribacteraceae bacterium]